MIRDHTIDLALIELTRTLTALKALRSRRRFNAANVDQLTEHEQHAAALRASMDLTRKLADLRQGR